MEMARQRLTIERFANITDETVVGVRTVLIGGDKQFSKMDDQLFSYDSSMIAPLSSVPSWPYTLHFRMPHTRHESQNCPSEPHQIWEMPINELVMRYEPEHDDATHGCHLVPSCPNLHNEEQFRQLLQNNFEWHYTTNRAPLTLTFEPSWLLASTGFPDVLNAWMSHILSTHSDVYFVTKSQVLKWMQNPTSVQSEGFLTQSCNGR